MNRLKYTLSGGKNMISTLAEKDYHREYAGLSSDPKPIDNVRNGSFFLEMDTGKVFAFDEANKIWREI